MTRRTKVINNSQLDSTKKQNKSLVHKKNLVSLENSIAQLKYIVSKNGYIYKEVKGDGNCLFRAISEHIYHTQEAHMHVRSRLVEHIKTHKFYKPFIENAGNDDFDAFIRKTSSLSTHGGHIELVACARCYGVKIEVYQLKYPKILIEGGWINEHDECGKCVCVSNSDQLPTIRLVYHPWGHYSCAIDPNINKKRSFFPLEIPK